MSKNWGKLGIQTLSPGLQCFFKSKEQESTFQLALFKQQDETETIRVGCTQYRFCFANLFSFSYIYFFHT